MLHEGIAQSKKSPLTASLSLKFSGPVHANIHGCGQSSLCIPEKSPASQERRAGFVGASLVLKGAAVSHSKAAKSGLGPLSPLINEANAADMQVKYQ